jgi:hypothetical protein
MIAQETARGLMVEVGKPPLDSVLRSGRDEASNAGSSWDNTPAWPTWPSVKSLHPIQQAQHEDEREWVKLPSSPLCAFVQLIWIKCMFR